MVFRKENELGDCCSSFLFFPYLYLIINTLSQVGGQISQLMVEVLIESLPVP